MPKGVPNKRYTPEFKKLVVETMMKEKLSYRETARRFEVNSHYRIQDWERVYLEEGPEGLAIERRGRSSTVRPKKLPKEVEEDPLAALLSKGEPLPFADEEEHTEPMTVIYQTTEDDADDTVVPRFNSAGGDGERLIFIKEDEKSLTFGDDRIREAVERCNAKLLKLRVKTILEKRLMKRNASNLRSRQHTNAAVTLTRYYHT